MKFPWVELRQNKPNISPHVEGLLNGIVAVAVQLIREGETRDQVVNRLTKLREDNGGCIAEGHEFNYAVDMVDQYLSYK